MTEDNFNQHFNTDELKKTFFSSTSHLWYNFTKKIDTFDEYCVGKNIPTNLIKKVNEGLSKIKWWINNPPPTLDFIIHNKPPIKYESFPTMKR